MTVRFRSWWKRIKQRRVVITVTAAIIVVAVVLIIIGYSFDWAGFNGYTQVSTVHTLTGPMAGTVTRTETYQPGKFLWDWLQLLIIPVVLAIGGYLFSFTTSNNERRAADQRNQTEREIAQDNQHETVLQEYIDKISELLLHEKLRESQPEDEVRTIARVRTLAALHRLDTLRKRNVLQFLLESKLIYGKKSIVDLDGADLSLANLREAFLNNANLSGANLSQADLSHAGLRSADLRHANLSDANLREAKLGDADLSGAKLIKADLQSADLRGALQLHFFGKTSP
jgi:Pentapeptide repeats (8 copies)